jgi:hypothetical protein
VVSADGLLLRRTPPTGALPTITTPLAPTGSHVGGAARREVALLAGAPYGLLAKVASAGVSKTLGLMVTLRNGPAIYFGDDTKLSAKWAAATAALAAPDSAGADYIDVTDPGRPAAGTGADGASGTPAGGSTGAGTDAATTTTGDTGAAGSTGQTP